MMRHKLAFALVLAAGCAPGVLAQPAPPSDEAPKPGAPAAEGRWAKTVPVIASGEWAGGRLADGQPDVAGYWSNTIANHSNFTDPQAGPPGEPTAASKLPRDQRAPSRVTDPIDGKVPYKPEARVLQEDFAANFPTPSKARYVEPLARCAPAGVPKSFMWHGFEIRQYAGTVLLIFDSGSRIIHLDETLHLPKPIKLWNGDSRGHWEGNTLVVDVRNNNGKALFGREGDYMTENATVQERFVFDPNQKRFNYVATFTDPTIYTRPFTATIPIRRYSEADTPDGWHYDAVPANRPGKPLLHERMERVCVENNGGDFGGGGFQLQKGPMIAR